MPQPEHKPAGRPLAGMEFVIKDAEERYRYRNFEFQPTEQGKRIYSQRLNGMTIPQLAGEYKMGETSIKRVIRNVGAWFRREQEARLKVR